MKAFGEFVAVVALGTVGTLWRGYVLTVLWAWFVVPTFGLAALALAPAIGLSLLVHFLTYQSDAAKPLEGSFSDRFAKTAGRALLWPALALGIGWVISRFM